MLLAPAGGQGSLPTARRSTPATRLAVCSGARGTLEKGLARALGQLLLLLVMKLSVLVLALLLLVVLRLLHDALQVGGAARLSVPPLELPLQAARATSEAGGGRLG